MKCLVVATRNQHKADEIQQVLGSEFLVLSLYHFPGVPPLAEDAHTFEGNARRKSEQLAEWLMPVGGGATVGSIGVDYVLADDSGLEVDALDGAPGVFSARFAAADGGAAGNSPDGANNAKLLRLLEGVPVERRSARFRCALALTELEPLHESVDEGGVAVAGRWKTEVFCGDCEGAIGFEPQGTGGFGYDPLFVPTGHRATFAQLEAAEKNLLSHRGRALAMLRLFFTERTASGPGSVQQ